MDAGDGGLARIQARKMRLAVIETAPYGGLLHYAFQLADGLAKGGDDVDLIVPRGNELSRQPGVARQRAVLPPPVSIDQRPTAHPVRRFARRARVAVRISAAWIRIVALVRRGRYDAAILTCDLSVAPAAIGANLLAGLPGSPPIADVCHNARIINRGAGTTLVARAPLTERILARALRRCAVVFVHGEKARAELREQEPSLEPVVIPHGDEAVFATDPPAPSAEPRALFFGSWARYKGLEVLMQAFDRLLARNPDARLTIAGEPSPHQVDVEAIQRWAAARPESVEIVGRYVPVDEVVALFARARLLVAPYTLGYQSGVVHLAMTMARAVVATNVGDLKTAVRDGETGFVVEPGDPAALSEALERLLADPSLADRMGRAGRARIEAHSDWGEVASQVREQLVRPSG